MENNYVCFFIDEYDMAKNCVYYKNAVWGNYPHYSETIRDIVNEILEKGEAVRGDTIYSKHDDEDDL